MRVARSRLRTACCLRFSANWDGTLHGRQVAPLPHRRDEPSHPRGAMAFNTPFKMWKRYEFNGGTSDPCVVSWPAGMKARGEIRNQYHHAIDLVPTVLDALGVRPPDAIKGYSQSHFDGVSMRYSFDAPSA